MVSETEILRIDAPGAPVRSTIAAALVHDGIAYLSGILAADYEGNLIGAGNPDEQAKACVDEIERVLLACGSTLDDILRCTAYATSEEAAFSYIKERMGRMTKRPAATTVLVSKLLREGAMLEVEVIARVPQAG